jgi:hypothetical protein
VAAATKATQAAIARTRLLDKRHHLPPAAEAARALSHA